VQSSHEKLKSTSANERFGASGGVGSTDTEQVTSSFALVRTLPMPPPAAKPLGVGCKPDNAIKQRSRNLTIIYIINKQILKLKQIIIFILAGILFSI